MLSICLLAFWVGGSFVKDQCSDDPYRWSMQAALQFPRPFWIMLAVVLSVTAFAWVRDRKMPPGHCKHCGYDLTGNVSGVCPECGHAVLEGG